MLHESCDIDRFHVRLNLSSHLCSYYTFYWCFQLKINGFWRIQPLICDFGAQILPFFFHMSHVYYMNHVILIVFMLDQTYLAIYAVIIHSINVFILKLTIFEGHSPVILELKFHHFSSIRAIYVTWIMLYWWISC